MGRMLTTVGRRASHAFVNGSHADCCWQACVWYSSGEFHVTFGISGDASAANCHTQAAVYLEKDLNQTASLVHLAKVHYLCWYTSPRSVVTCAGTSKKFYDKSKDIL